MSVRLSLALDSGDLLPCDKISVVMPTPDHDLSDLPKTTHIVQPFKPFHDHFQSQGFACTPVSDDPCDLAIVFVPRAKALARDLVARASRQCSGWVLVDGTKTDGIDSLLKDIRKRVAVSGPISKAHGKIFWFPAQEADFADWLAPEAQVVDGFQVAPGVFSADGVDPASALLAQVLPEKLGCRVVDLGAGWGYLSAQVLKNAKVEQLDLVEADHTALTCARANITDPRARFHWADAHNWAAGELVDTVVTNPPFHTSRAADPALGRGFIATAARILAPSGQLWLVANRHLPYETTLAELFGQVKEVAGDNRFKILQATRPARTRR
ncbi:class I SAM-dependent methyltransferase [Falsiruegeria mediterranea]|uniref:Ribosomal RNA large subunit methyltransferase G n=1 Tax=Falsiruegeria mediterranea M17 TaxID=1200281 RepID=A0A2R8C5V9_9RHOB|nr:class I SAM-dependent methyltransferase [Falsiruegeria mediterranea]SPJ27756.1 Ribosomal RNA large subunit methyltransferase G [Falsiruegeria mediterranea M17]